MKKIVFLFFLVILFSCSTIQFGIRKNKFLEEDAPKQDVKPFNLGYSYKVFGIEVSGNSIVENIFAHPDQKAYFVFISFPKIGILKTVDYGKTFTSSFFTLKGLDISYGYNNDEDDNDNKNNKQEKQSQSRIFGHFTTSSKDQKKIIISLGSYVFLSDDYGTKWRVKNLFFDNEKSNIRNIFVNAKDEIFIFSENKIAVSKNWGKSWSIKYIKLNNGYNVFKTNYITGLYDNSTDIIYASFKHNDEEDNFLSRMTYQYLYQNKNTILKSGLFYSKDFGKTWTKTNVNIPLNLWKYNNKIYGSSIYPLSFYKKNYSQQFIDSDFYKLAKLDNSTYMANEYLKTLLELDSDDFQIISQKDNKIVEIENTNANIIEENNFENIYYGLKKIEKIDYIQWQENWFTKKRSPNFFYEYNSYKLFKMWNGMQTTSPILYLKEKDVYYRIKPKEEYLKVFFKYVLENQIKLNSINPFLRKPSDIEFFDPDFDPTNGFPVTVEYSTDFAKTWKELNDSKYIRNIIDPIGNKRTGLYWYKPVDQRKLFKLQISFGFDKGASFSVYPTDLEYIDGDLLIMLNYFSLLKSYKEVYLIKGADSK